MFQCLLCYFSLHINIFKKKTINICTEKHFNWVENGFSSILIADRANLDEWKMRINCAINQLLPPVQDPYFKEIFLKDTERQVINFYYYFLAHCPMRMGINCCTRMKSKLKNSMQNYIATLSHFKQIALKYLFYINIM